MQNEEDCKCETSEDSKLSVNLFRIALVVCAAVLMYCGKDGWGWLIAILILCT